MSDTPRTPSRERRPQQRNHLLIVMGVLVVLAAALAIAARDVWTEEEVAPPPTAKSQAASESPAKPKPRAEAESNIIDDDGTSLWVSPTAGPPLDLAYLPPGVEIILALRPAGLLAHPEGVKVISALGPWASTSLRSIETTSGTSSDNIDRLIIGIQNVRNDLNWAAMVLRTTTPIEPTLETTVPDDGQGRTMLIGPADFQMSWRELQTTPAPVSRDVDRLIRRTDSDRTLTLIARPQSLYVDGGRLFVGELEPLRTELEAIFGKDVAAISLSLDWQKDFFVELIAVPTLDSSPKELSDKLAAWIKQLPDSVEVSVLTLNTSPYSRRVVARLPEMVRRLAAYTRHGYDRDAAILRCYLPVTAGHNLLLATELALAESQTPRDSQASVAAPAEPRPPASIAERLKKRTTLRFGREELEAALHMLAEDVGVPITIRGQDLQLDGITRNQLFAIDLADRPAEEILVEILRRANPDKTATGPADPRQKLVYVVGADGIIITTRSQAAERGEALPTAFRAE